MVDYTDVAAARERLAGIVNRTPVLCSRWLNSLSGAELFFKCENFQRMGAFKFRGAFNAIVQLTSEQRARGVITHSSGNHAQAVALAARLLDVRAMIVMPEGSPKVKVQATRDTYGAEVVFCGNSQESRETTTDRLIKDEGFCFVHPSDNEQVIAGAGTATLELLEDLPDLDMVIAPVGGGGLLSGTALAAKGIRSDITVCAAEPESVDDAYRSLQEGRIMSNQQTATIADGLKTHLSERTFSIIQDNVSEIVTVSEEQIISAMRLLWERMKIVVEPSGAVALAGVLSEKRQSAGKRIGVILSGGNVDLQVFFRYLEDKIAGI
jgi:threonine dehydratase